MVPNTISSPSRRLQFVQILDVDSPGITVIELIVSAAILLIAIAASVSLFNSYIRDTSTAKQRDGITTVILKDLEGMKYSASRLWLSSGASTTSITVYTPPSANCSADTLGSAAVSQDSKFTSGSSIVSLDSTTAQALGNPTITRSISHSGNLINIVYSTSSPVPTRVSTSLLPSAIGWCP
jgi:type II secretory pathway pseudopilin PulG